MAIYTSRYSNKELESGDYYPVGISRGTPRFKIGYTIRERYTAIAPTWAMMHMSKDSYIEEYEKLLESNREKIIRDIARMDRQAASEQKQLVLLCFEDVRDPEQWCHRNLFAEWWMIQTGEIVEELQDPTPPKKKKAEKEKKPEKAPEAQYMQMSLFDMVLA